MKKLFGRTKRRSGATPYPRAGGAAPGTHAPLAGTTSGGSVAPSSTRGRGGSSADLRVTLKIYLAQHLEALFASLAQLSRSPLSVVLTAAVIGIALALPTGLHVIVDNAQRISAAWQGGARISLFLKQDVDDAAAERLAERVRALPGVGAVQVVARAQALEEFRQLSGFGAALDLLQENPLPALLIVRPQDPNNGTASALATQGLKRITDAARRPDGLASTRRLLAQLHALPEVEVVQADMQWLQRLHAIMATAQRGVAMLATLLAVAVLLIVGNTIRLTIYSRRDEIEIVKLIGGTDGFIQRPFMYNGLWYGLLGGLIAWGVVSVALAFLQAPVSRLALLYQSDFRLSGLDAAGTLWLLGAALALGLCGSLLAVKRHLAAIEPS